MENFEFSKERLSILDKRINAFAQGYRQNIAILGNDEHEISYLLENYLKENKLKEIVYIQTAAAYADRKSFFKSVAHSLLGEYLNKCDTLDNLINYSYGSLNTTVNFIKDIIRRTQHPSFLEVLEAINKFINESGKRCIFIVENLLDLKKIFPAFHNDFSKFIILQRNCMIVLTSPHMRESEKTLYSELNFLFGSFEKIILSETNFLENYMYLKKTFTPLQCSPFFISFFVNILGLNNIYYELAGRAAKDKYNPCDEEASIVAIARQMFFCRETYIFQKFIQGINTITHNLKNSSSAAKVLIALSEGYIRKRDLVSLHILETKELTAKLQKLCDINYVENLGNVYKIKDPLFSFWLSHVFKLNFCPPLPDRHKRDILFEAKLRQTISVFKEEFFKDKVKKVLELIASFKNDTLRMGRARCHLPLITKSRLMSYPEKNLHFLIGEGHEIIFVAIKESCVDDNDVFDFIEKGSVIKGKGVRKIFISLDTFSASAKLAAKNNKLITWDINEINDLMRVYQRPIIACDRQPEQRVSSESLSNF